jgi:hypothetical protein
MPKCHDVRQFAPIQPRIERLHREPFRTSVVAVDDSPDNLSRPVFEMARHQVDGVAAYSTCRSTRAIGCSIRRAAMAATCPMHRDEGSAAVFKGLSRRILDLADLRKLPREWPFHIAPSAPQELLSAINPFEFACANRVRNGRSDVASSNSARLHVGSTGRFWRKAVGKAGSWQNFPRWLNLAQTSP